MARRRERCGSRNTTTGRPCKLPKGSCPHPAHRKPDRVANTGSPAPHPASPRLAAAGVKQPASVHPGGPTPAALQTMVQRCAQGVLSPAVIEREYWMFQIARMLQADSKKHPGGVACMSGGSMLALVGITERLSEDADFNISFPGGVAACSNNQGKNLLNEHQQHVAASLGVSAQRQGKGGGNLFRKVHYAYPSVIPAAAVPFVESDMGIRDTDPQYIITMAGRPYLARAGVQLPASAAGASIRCMHPITTLADKLDAVCWREKAPNMPSQQRLTMLAQRVRDHYDLYMLLRWLAANNHLSAKNVQDAVDHMYRSDAGVRARRNVNRPIVPGPAGGYRTLDAWQPGTLEYQTLQAVYPALQQLVYGHFPSWGTVAAAIRNCPYI